MLIVIRKEIRLKIDIDNLIIIFGFWFDFWIVVNGVVVVGGVVDGVDVFGIGFDGVVI